MDFFENIDKTLVGFIEQMNYKPALDMFLSINSGKKLRSKLLVQIAGKNDDTLLLCAVIELIHAASLLHDDVIDQSDTRRGKPSINATFGSKNAIMLGDILYTKGYFELLKFDNFIATCICDAVNKLSIGELMDVELSRNFNTDKSAYIQMIYYKTAILIEATTKSGAFLANESLFDKMNLDDFGIYGKNLGIAFQIVDDLLDVTSDSKTLGKPSFSDFTEGKTTLPYIYLYEVANNSEKDFILKSFKKNLSDEEISHFKELFAKYNIIEKCINDVKFYCNLAIESIKKYNQKELIDIINALVDRKF